jgi:hypothetical protein
MLDIYISSITRVLYILLCVLLATFAYSCRRSSYIERNWTEILSSRSFIFFKYIFFSVALFVKALFVVSISPQSDNFVSRFFHDE